MKVLLVQPSSTATERVFSILNSSFNDSQEHAQVKSSQVYYSYYILQKNHSNPQIAKANLGG